MKSDSGSILPLAIAVIVFTLVIGLVFLELGGIQLQTVRNKQISDSLALELAGQLKADAVAPVIGLDYAPALEPELNGLVKLLRLEPKSLSVISQDGKTVEAIFCTPWESVTGLTLGMFGDVCVQSKARAIT